jgi:ABC-type polysaccharide/polyol phosphate transport system ATPase subunit
MSSEPAIAQPPIRSAAATRPIALSIQGIGKLYRVGPTARGANLLSEWLNRRGVQAMQRLRGTQPSDGEVDRWLWALRGVSFDVHFGETLGVVGRNGAGKSTLLKLMSRITAPTEGRIVTYGRVTGLLEVGTGFHPELSGRENVFLNASLLGMSRRETQRRFDEIVDFSGVREFLEMPVKRYSSGMYMRLAFSVAAHLEPEILLVDEVLAVGDAEFQQRCLDKLKAVSAQGKAVVFVSHGLGTVRDLCDRVILLDRGNLEVEGNPEAVITEYVDRLQPESEEIEVGGERHIPPDAHRTGDGRARLERVRLIDAEGSSRSELLPGEPFRVEAEFTIAESVNEAIFEVGIASATGDRFATARSTDDGGGTVALTSGSHSVRVDLAPALVEGEYVLQVGVLAASDGEPLDFVDRALRFHVVDESGAEPPRGYVRLPGRWHAN